MTRPKYLHQYPCAPLPYWTLCLSEVDFKRELRELKSTYDMPWIAAGADAMVHRRIPCTGQGRSFTSTLVCARIPPGQDPIITAGLLVHEAVHIWQDYCDQFSMHAPGEEQEAYAIQGIAQELMWEYVRQTRGKA